MNLMLIGRDQYRLAGPRWLRDEEGVWALDPLDQADGKLFSQTTVEVRHPGCTVETEGHGPTSHTPSHSDALGISTVQYDFGASSQPREVEGATGILLRSTLSSAASSMPQRTETQRVYGDQ